MPIFKCLQCKCVTHSKWKKYIYLIKTEPYLETESFTEISTKWKFRVDMHGKCVII